MDVSIIIVNWNSKEYLKKCITSILASTSGITYEIVVIDSGSFDGAGELIRKCYPQIRFIQSEENLGFAKANNVAFKATSGRNILFLNPDTELEGPAVQTMNRHLDSLPNAGVVGARVLNSDLSFQSSCVQPFPTILNQVLDSDVLRTIFPEARIWGVAPSHASDSGPTEVDAISGAALMTKRAVFETVGMFSTDYFMYSEDIDLCFKVKQVGWKTYFLPMAVIVHHGGVSSSQSNVDTFSSVMLLESQLRFFRKTRSLWYCWLYRLAMLLASVIRIGLVLVIWPIYGLRGRGASPRKILKEWRARLGWTLGGEGWAKRY